MAAGELINDVPGSRTMPEKINYYYSRLPFPILMLRKPILDETEQGIVVYIGTTRDGNNWGPTKMCQSGSVPLETAIIEAQQKCARPDRYH